MDLQRPVPKPRTRTIVSSGDLSKSPPKTDSDSPLVPRQAWSTSDNVTGSNDFDPDQMYTDDDGNSDGEAVEDDEDEFYDVRSSPSRFHPEDPLKGITTQSHSPSRPPFSGDKPVRTPSNTSEEGSLLRREVTDLKNKKIALQSEIEQLSRHVEMKKREIEGLNHDAEMRKQRLEEKESALQLRERNVLTKEQTLAVERGNINIKLKKLAHRETELQSMEDNMIVRKKALDEREDLLRDLTDENGSGMRKKDKELRSLEDELKRKEDRLTKWSQELHEEAERIRLKGIQMEQEFTDKMAAMNLMEQESNRGPSVTDNPSSVLDPQAQQDLELARSIQEQMWQVCVCVFVVCVCACSA